MSEKEIKQRVKFVNPNLPLPYIEAGKSAFASLGHHNNWEWLCSYALHNTHTYYVIYKELHNKIFDRYYRRARSRFGTVPLEKKSSPRVLLNDHKSGKPVMAAFLNDQRPKPKEIQFWMPFLNQETPVLLGTEKLAKKVDAVVYGLEMRKVKRGFYEVEYTLITDNAKAEPQYEITRKHTRFLEGVVRRNPEFYLWTHDRWKFKKEDFEK